MLSTRSVDSSTTSSTIDKSSSSLAITNQMRVDVALEFLEAFCEGKYSLSSLCTEHVRLYSDREEFVGLEEVQKFVGRRKRRGELQKIVCDESRRVVLMSVQLKYRFHRVVAEELEFGYSNGKINFIGMVKH